MVQPQHLAHEAGAQVLDGLSDHQKEIVRHTEGNVLTLASAGSGKALPDYANVKTPQGDILIDQLQEGQAILNTYGSTSTVTGIYPQGDKEIWEVEFSDGTIIESSKDHLWTYQTASQRNQQAAYRTATLEEIAEIPLRVNGGAHERWNVYIPMADPVAYPTQEFEVSPYLLGLLLGDGYLREAKFTFSNSEADVLNRLSEELDEIGYRLEHIDRYDYSINMQEQRKVSPIRLAIDSLGLVGCRSYEKFIPKPYMLSSVDQRLDLIKGLIDTDGECSASQYYYNTSSEQLAFDVVELAQSLGLTASVEERRTQYTHQGEKRDGRLSYRVTIKTSDHIPKIHASDKHEAKWSKGQSVARRTIRRIEPTGKYTPMTCIKVDADDECFLTDGYVVTHNTRVLTRRIAYLLENDVPAWQILAMTFTNKAAGEMKERINQMVPSGASELWIGTFHSICLQILFRHQEEIGLPEGFTIIDPKDQQKIMKEQLEKIGSQKEGKTILNLISDFKNELKTPQMIHEEAENPNERLIANLYTAYEDVKDESHYLDFDDLLMKVVFLFRYHPNVRDKYQKRFRYVLSDEVQDSNIAQFELLKLFSMHHQNLFAVGDVDQCQPPETMVQTPYGHKRIDELQNGDHVSAWGRKEQYTNGLGYPVEVASRPYQGNMMTIQADGKSTRATPNHKFIARWTDRPQNIWVTYLMYREDRGYRVGWCQLFNVDRMFHAGARARLEGAEKMWILATHESKKEATIYESIMSTRYGVPTTMFEPNDELYTEDVIAQIFEASDVNGGVQCLHDHHMEVDCPLYPYPQEVKGRPTFFECYASNLIPGLMSLPLPSDRYNRNQWATIEGVDAEYYEGDVYSLDVETHHNYVADGLVTLNSIFGFRGAQIDNMLSFEKTLSDVTTYRLEENYRSTGNIIEASNAVIEHNTQRLDKTAFTRQDDGAKIKFYHADDDSREAEFVCDVIQQQITRGDRPPNEIGVLFRTNAQSRVIEMAMNKRRIPYHLVGGTGFFERKEIKDAIAYLRAIDNASDHLALERIINTPKRKIGDTTVNKVKEYADSVYVSLPKALEHADDVPNISKPAKASITQFVSIIQSARTYAQNHNVLETFQYIMQQVDFLSQFDTKKEEDEQRRENIEELERMIGEWLHERDDDQPTTITAFLQENMLASDLDELEDGGAVHMMSVHKAKGLEYDVVLVVGCNDDIFPHARSKQSTLAVEEERRLFYVALTRAREQLYITMCRQKFMQGRVLRQGPSPFLKEIPKTTLQSVSRRT